MGGRFAHTGWLILIAAAVTRSGAQAPTVDLGGYRPECGIVARPSEHGVDLRWPIGGGLTGELRLDLRTGRPLIAALGLAAEGGPARTLLSGLQPVTFVTVGTREEPPGRPPTLTHWDVFFDHPGRRPYRTYLATLTPGAARVVSEGRRATVAIPGLTAGPFTGELQITLYAGAPLVHVEAVVRTTEDRRAILYDAGLVGESPGWSAFVWLDPHGREQRAAPDVADRPLAVKHRIVAAEGPSGAVACFPPPHQFFFPTDWTENFRYAWIGRGHQQSPLPTGLGVRQDPVQRGAFVPWFNAPPDVAHRLGVFYLLSAGSGRDAIREALRFTRGDRFAPVPGHITLTSHWHMAVAVGAMQRQFQGMPDYITVFKEMGVNAVHLADFHGDGHPKDPGPLRLPELAALFRECRRLSDDEFSLIPGEEVNDYLGIREPGKHPGHWMSLFPKPVYWIQRTTPRGPNEPFVEAHPDYGTVYRVGSRDDMVELIRRERGLVWTAHPRIKASSWTPDIFRNEAFFRADWWLGAAWKAMPADLSRPRLGERALAVLDDMANWGNRKYLLGEVDVFQIDRTHELFGHMNINYVRLDRLPRFDEGWQPILDALRAGRFWVTTGEVLLRRVTVGGREPGDTLRLPADGRAEIRVEAEWTFPLRAFEIVSGDGERTYRERIALPDTGAFGTRTLTARPHLRGRKWVRIEVWDVATNGAFSQPVWLVE